MSDTDSFIEEVTEEVRRDRMFGLLKRYGWIAVLAIVLIVGGAAFNEYRKAQATAAAQELGDAIIAALSDDDATARAGLLAGIETDAVGGAAIADLLEAGALANSGDDSAAVNRLQQVATQPELPEIYRNIAAFKALLLQGDSLSIEERRLQFDALARPGAPLRLLSEEQLALLDIEEGNVDKAIERLQAILEDSEVSADLQQRAVRVIVALGGVPGTVASSEG
ncbi:MAG: hypothetical protein GJ676_04165 [Rhodobacteraceae bacterium]|nr:hypothetical protein [Paracoccaceae bacterium]